METISVSRFWKEYVPATTVVNAFRYNSEKGPWPMFIKNDYSSDKKVTTPVLTYLENEFGKIPVGDGDWIINHGNGHMTALSDEIFSLVYYRV